MRGSSTSMTSRSHPSSRGRSSVVVIAAIGAASASMNSIRAAGSRRVDRQIGRPGLEHRQHRHDRLGRPRQQQRHTLPRARPLTGQQVRQPVGGLIELAVGHRAALAGHRHRLRGAGHLRGEQHRNRHRARCRLGQHRPVAPPIQPGVLSLHRADPSTTTAGSGRRSSPPPPAPTARSASRCWPRRTRRCEIPPPRRSRRAHRPRSSVRPRENVRSMRAVLGVHRQRGDLQITQSQPGGGIVLPGSSARPTSPAPAGDGSGIGSG